MIKIIYDENEPTLKGDELLAASALDIAQSLPESGIIACLVFDIFDPFEMENEKDGVTYKGLLPHKASFAIDKAIVNEPLIEEGLTKIYVEALQKYVSATLSVDVNQRESDINLDDYVDVEAGSGVVLLPCDGFGIHDFSDHNDSNKIRFVGLFGEITPTTLKAHLSMTARSSLPRNEKLAERACKLIGQLKVKAEIDIEE
jgi:hypothetical protein